MKQICRICDKNISNEKYEKLNYGSKMKELNYVVLRKTHFASVKGHLFFIKGHSDDPEGQVEVEPPRNQKLFLKSLI